MQPIRKHPEHQRKTARQRTGIVLPQSEFSRMECSLDSTAIEAFACQLGQNLQTPLLDPVDEIGLHPLQPDPETNLGQTRLQPTAGQILTQIRIDQRLAQRRT